MKTKMLVTEVFAKLKEKLNTHSFDGSHKDESMVDTERSNVAYFLTKYAKDTLADRIYTSHSSFKNFTDKQLWVFAFELVKIQEYVQQQIEEEMGLNGAKIEEVKTLHYSFDISKGFTGTIMM